MEIYLMPSCAGVDFATTYIITYLVLHPTTEWQNEQINGDSVSRKYYMLHRFHKHVVWNE